MWPVSRLAARADVDLTPPEELQARRRTQLLLLALSVVSVLAAAIYFAIVGLQLDLVRGFSPGFFLLFLLLACAIKGGSVYLGARLAGQASASSWNLAVALNARGGPGIVVASVAYGAGIIGQPFYAVLVMLAIVTSLFAGSWLAHVPRERLLTQEQLLTEERTSAWRRPWRAGRGSAPEPTDP